MTGDGSEPPVSRRRALAQIVLGQAQIVAAVTGLVLLVTTGLSPATLATVATAGVLGAVSNVAYRDTGPKG